MLEACCQFILHRNKRKVRQAWAFSKDKEWLVPPFIKKWILLLFYITPLEGLNLSFWVITLSAKFQEIGGSDGSERLVRIRKLCSARTITNIIHKYVGISHAWRSTNCSPKQSLTNYRFSPVNGLMVNRQYGFVTVFLGPAEPIFLKFGTNIEKTKLNFNTGPKFDKKWIKLN